jgi:hypothetical protein
MRSTPCRSVPACLRSRRKGREVPIIYKLTVRATGKSYIGQTSLANYAARRSAHMRRPPRAMRNALPAHAQPPFHDHLDFHILHQLPPGAGRLDTDRMERHLIQLHNTARPHGYNYLRCGAPYRDRQYWAMQKAKGNKPAYYKRRDTAPA